MVSKKKSKNYLDYYKNIETLPVWNWDKINSTGEVKYMAITDDYSNVNNEPIYEIAFDKCFDEFYDYFGVSIDLKEYLNAKRSILFLKIDYALTKKPLILTKIKQKELAFENLYKSSDSVNVGKIAVMLSSWLKFHIDIKKISVREFYEYLNEYKKLTENGKN